MNKYPKISIVTPTYNQGQYIEDTILSVLGQNYPNIEYIIIDGGSTDNTIEIIKKYEDKLTYWISEPDKGIYDALQKGFEKTTGDIMGWINSDDMLHRNSLYILSEVFNFADIKWIQGIPTEYDEKGRTIYVGSQLRPWSKFEFWGGDYQWIQQESTFWHRDLWNKAGKYISQEYKYAGDMELWNRFFRYEKLYSIQGLIGGFRRRLSDQLSLDHLDDYSREANIILQANEFDKDTQIALNTIATLKDRLAKYVTMNRIIRLLRKQVFCRAEIACLKKKLNRLYDYPPFVFFDRIKQHYYIDKQ